MGKSGESSTGPQSPPRKYPSFKAWRRKIDHFLVTEYFIDFEQAGISEEELHHYWQDNRDPKEFVEWFAEKYDLIPKNEWGWS